MGKLLALMVLCVYLILLLEAARRYLGIVVFALVLCGASTASAGWGWVKHHSGYWLYSNGSTNDGWYYTRGQYCDSCGHCHWKYYRHHAYVAPAAAPNYSQNETVPQAVLAIAKQEQEYKFVQQSLRELGYVKGGYPGYGGQPVYAPQAGYENAPQAGTPGHGQHGSTFYGYSRYATHQPLTREDIMSLMDKSFRGRDQAHQQFVEANAGVMATTGQVAADQLTAAKAEVIRDFGAALVDKIANLQSPEIHAETVFRAEANASASAGQAEAEPAEESGDAAEGASKPSPNPDTVQWQKQLAASIDGRCVSCHSGNAPKGGFDMTQTLEFDKPTWLKIVERVTSTDDDLRMPRAADGPGHPLPESEQMLYVRKYTKAK